MLASKHFILLGKDPKINPKNQVTPCEQAHCDCGTEKVPFKVKEPASVTRKRKEDRATVGYLPTYTFCSE